MGHFRRTACSGFVFFLHALWTLVYKIFYKYTRFPTILLLSFSIVQDCKDLDDTFHGGHERTTHRLCLRVLILVEELSGYEAVILLCPRPILEPPHTTVANRISVVLASCRCSIPYGSRGGCLWILVDAQTTKLFAWVLTPETWFGMSKYLSTKAPLPVDILTI
jgi:hypothetical protein